LGRVSLDDLQAFESERLPLRQTGATDMQSNASSWLSAES
jgi:hypothetical protein